MYIREFAAFACNGKLLKCVRWDYRNRCMLPGKEGYSERKKSFFLSDNVGFINLRTN